MMPVAGESVGRFHLKTKSLPFSVPKVNSLACKGCVR